MSADTWGPSVHRAAGARMSPLDEARKYKASGDGAHRVAVDQARRLRYFGTFVAEPILRAIEDVTECADEMAHHYEQAIAEEREKSLAIANEARRAQDLLKAAASLLTLAALETEARYRRARRPAPEWVARANTTAIRIQEPF